MTLNTYSTISESIEKLYDDYLYDCYVANQRLTEEDWLYFGRELHHVVIPDRDQGVLCPLNSQYLTTYQHWVAGVLQSELLGKCCFAMVPAGELPTQVELLRRKWIAEHIREGTRNMGKEKLTARNKKSRQAQIQNSTPEQRSQIARTRQQNKTPEQRRLEALKAWETKRQKQKQ